MDIYTAIGRVIIELLAVTNGTLGHLVNLPANASGPLDANASLTDSGTQFVEQIAAAAIKASDILCNIFEALF